MIPMPKAKVRRRAIVFDPDDVKFYEPETGHLTPYALSCGYIEEYKCPGRCMFRLYQEDGVYHVRGRHKHNTSTGNGVVWETLDTLRSARQFARLQGTFQPAEDAFSGI